MSLPNPQLDHIVIHLPYSDILNPPSWLTDLFAVSPGGKHGDGKTENKLIIFADGTYLELIAFTSEGAKEGHWWGDKGYGIIDYAFTLPGNITSIVQDYDKLKQRWDRLNVPAGWKPGELKEGSRLRPDGTRIEWRVAFPEPRVRGVAPFWCFDVTPRELRVPVESKNVNHACGAVGVSQLILYTSFSSSGGGDGASGLKTMLDAALPQSGTRMDDTTWDVVTPVDVERGVPCSVALMQAKEKYEVEKLADGRKCVARLVVSTDGRDESFTRHLRRVVEGDEVSVGFVTH